MRKKEKIIDNIKSYSSYETVLVMKKPKSPLTVAFLTDDLERWFIDKITYLTKSGKINDKGTIIAKDLPGFVEFYEHDGYSKI
jgi:hypothetical protein